MPCVIVTGILSCHSTFRLIYYHVLIKNLDQSIMTKQLTPSLYTGRGSLIISEQHDLCKLYISKASYLLTKHSTDNVVLLARRHSLLF